MFRILSGSVISPCRDLRTCFPETNYKEKKNLYRKQVRKSRYLGMPSLVDIWHYSKDLDVPGKQVPQLASHAQQAQVTLVLRFPGQGRRPTQAKRLHAPLRPPLQPRMASSHLPSELYPECYDDCNLPAPMQRFCQLQMGLKCAVLVVTDMSSER